MANQILKHLSNISGLEFHYKIEFFVSARPGFFMNKRNNNYTIIFNWSTYNSKNFHGPYT